jgi:putative toxin-antitoxin system antitoxin component (TIGR02293 family)
MSKTMMTANLTTRLDREISVIVNQSGHYKTAAIAKRSFTFADFLSDRMLIIDLIRRGVPYSLFHLIQSYTPFTEDDWVGFLDLSKKSLQRYKQSSKDFGPLQSEKIIEMSEVTNVGLDVFGDMNKFKLWLDTPNFALGKLRPKELLKDSYGKDMVIGELVKINYGILA